MTRSTKNDALTPQQEKTRARAKAGLSAINSGAMTATALSTKGFFGELDPNDAISVLETMVHKIHAGDMREVETMLAVQATTLNAIFNNLAARSSLSIGEDIGIVETHMRMALRAQNQCRATLETLAVVKNPRATTFVRQQNNAHQQQVNNDAPGIAAYAPTEKILENPSNELLELQHGERLDTRAQGAAGSINPNLEAVGKINRGANSSRKGSK